MGKGIPGYFYRVSQRKKFYKGEFLKKFLAMALVAATMAFAGGRVAPIAEVEIIEVEPVKSGFYVGAGYSALADEFSESGYGVTFSDTYNYNEFMIDAGYNINEYVAVEGRYWFGFNNTNNVFDGDGYLFSSEDSADAYGVYVKPQYPVTTELNVYGLLGYANTEFTFNGIVNDNIELDGFSWGLGADYAVTPCVSVFIDYVSLYDDEVNVLTNYDTIVFEDRIDTVNLGINYSF